MKFTYQILLLAGTLMFSCSEDGPSEKILMTIESPKFSNKEEFFLITDINGTFLDSARLTESNYVELSGSEANDRIIFSRINLRSNNTMTILSYFNIKPGSLNRLPVAGSNSFIKLNIHDDMNSTSDNYVVSGSSTHRGGGSQFPYSDFTTSNDNKIAASWKGENQTPKFHMYSGFSHGSELTIKPVDFTDEMSLHQINSAETWDIISFNGNESISSYALGLFQDSNGGIYYPKNYFESFEIRFSISSIEDNVFYTTTYYGSLPTTVEKLEKGQLTIPNNTENYKASSTNTDIDVIESVYTDGSNYISIYGSNGESLKVTELLTTIQTLLPEYNLKLSQKWVNTYLYEIENQDYDKYIEEYLNQSNTKTRLRICDIVPAN